MTKFFQMRAGQDRELDALAPARGTATTPLFTIKEDPRITPVGKFIRKYS